MNKFADFVTLRKTELVGFTGIIILSFIAYGGIGTHQFLNWDDITYILENRFIHSLSTDNLIWMFTNYEQQNWHPLTWLSFTLNFELWGKNPVAFKLVNISIHILNSILVYSITFKLLSAAQRNYHQVPTTFFSKVTCQEITYGSLLAALLFAIHPIHVESVTWIVERKDVLSACFYFSTILAYIKYKESGDQVKWLNISVILFLFSLMSKPMGVTIPAVLMLLDIYPFNALSKSSSYTDKLRTLVQNKLSFIILSILVSGITLITQRGGIQDLVHYALDTRIINACMTIILYVYNFLWPTSLSPFYPFHFWSTEPNLYSIIPLSVVTIITGYFIYLWRKKVFFPLIALCYCTITLLPVIGIIKVGFQAAADRYTYIPLLSIFIVTGAGLAILSSYAKQFSWAKYVLLIGIILLTGFYTTQTINYNKVWQSDKTLWNRVIAEYPGSAGMGYSNMGTFYYTQGDFKNAILYFNKTLAIEPESIDVMEKIAKTYELAGKDYLAMPHYKQIILTHPDSPRGYTLLGDFLYRRKKVEDAKRLYRKAFSLAPQIASTLQRSALVDYLERNYVSAKQKLDYLLSLNPEDIGGLQLSAKLALKTNDTTTAKQLAEKILALRANDDLATKILKELSTTTGFK